MKNKISFEQPSTLMIEISRINNLIGNQLILENIFDELVDKFIKKAGISSSKPVEIAMSKLKTKFNTALKTTPPTQLRLGDIIDDLDVIAKNDEFLAEIIGKDIIMKLYPELKLLIDKIVKEIDVKALSGDEIKKILSDAIDEYYKGRLKPKWYKTMKELVLNERYITEIKSIKGRIEKLVEFLTPESIKLFGTMVRKMFTSQELLQKKFIEVANNANKKLEVGINHDSEFKEMFALLAAVKKNFDNLPKYVLDNIWLQDPFFKRNPKVAKYFEEFLVKDLQYKELYEFLQKKDPGNLGGTKESIEDWFKRYRSIWPFKGPKTPGGWWIFSNKFSPSRTATFILTKSPKTLNDINKYLLSRGVKSGMQKLITFRFVLLWIIYPILIAHAKSAINASEELGKFFGDGENFDWVDFEENTWNQFLKESYIWAIAFGKDFGQGFEWWDNQTYANEVWYFYQKVGLLGGRDPEEIHQESINRLSNDSTLITAPSGTTWMLKNGKVPPTGQNPTQGTPTTSPTQNTTDVRTTVPQTSGRGRNTEN
jgi:hypothetical protein